MYYFEGDRKEWIMTEVPPQPDELTLKRQELGKIKMDIESLQIRAGILDMEIILMQAEKRQT